MAASTEESLTQTLDQFSTITQNPEDFVTIHTGHGKSLNKTLKCIYDTKKAVDSSKAGSALSELIVDDFDDEQVWQQLELENESLFTELVSRVAKICADKNLCSFASKTPEESSVISKENDTRSKKLSKKKKKTKKEEIPQESDSAEDLVNHSEDLEDEFSLNESDEELGKIQSRLGDFGEENGDDFDKDDKFFDFTGDSDDDLNFDFGPLSKKGHLDIDDEEGQETKSKKGSKKGKKSVTFKDEVDEGMFGDQDDEFGMPSTSQANKGKSKTVRGLMRKKGSIVDDKFFKLYEMEAFLNQEDKREERMNRKRNKEFNENEDDSSDEEDDEEEIDMFGDIPSDDETYHYADFFDGVEDDGNAGGRDTGNNQLDEHAIDVDDNFEVEDREEDFDGNGAVAVKGGRPKDLFANSDSDGEDADTILGHKQQSNKSTYELRQEKLKNKIASMEEASLSDKPWQLMGEIGSLNRPENSLLQENLQFELTSRLAPEITEETTLTLEQLIKQRIKDKAWNDVERKVKPKENATEYKKRVTLDQEKSKQSLGEIYEQEYLKQQAKEKEDEEEPVHKEHEEIKKMMQSLFIKLDALSNYSYTPKQAMAEVKIIADQPSINMEEVAPVSFSNQAMLAPQEIQAKQQGELKGDTEKTKTDKLSARRKKKIENKRKRQERKLNLKQIEKMNPGLGNTYSKARALRQLEKDSKSGKKNVKMIKGDKGKANLTSSKAFFTQLQDEVKANINSKRNNKRKGQSDQSANAKKFKL